MLKNDGLGADWGCGVKIITDSPAGVINSEVGIDQSNWDAPAHLAAGQLAMHRLFRTVALEPAGEPLPLPIASTPLDTQGLLFPDPLHPDRQLTLEQLLNRRIFNDGLLIMWRGEVLHESYRNGMQAGDRHVIHSCTKSLCAMIAAMAIDLGLLNTATEVSEHLPVYGIHEAWQGVTVQHLLDMQAGIHYSEDYSDPTADYWGYARAAGYYPPLPGEPNQGAAIWMEANLSQRESNPGTVFSYNSCLTMVLGQVLEVVFEMPLAQIFEHYLYQRVGAEQEAWFNTDCTGYPIVEGQLNLCLRDFARCAYPLVNGGRNLAGENLVPTNFETEAVTPDQDAFDAYARGTADSVFPHAQYRNKLWVLSPHKQQFAMLGIHGQFAWYDLGRDLMIVGLGSYPEQDSVLLSRSLNTLWQGLANSLG